MFSLRTARGSFSNAGLEEIVSEHIEGLEIRLIKVLQIEIIDRMNFLKNVFVIFMKSLAMLTEREIQNLFSIFSEKTGSK